MIATEASAGQPMHPVASSRSGEAYVSNGPAFAYQRMEAQAERIPDAVAAACGDRSLSYRELNEQANRLAWKLRALQVKPNTPVGICLDRSLELIVAIYGVLKAGGMYVPLDPAYPSQRLAFMAESVNAPVAICGAEHISTFGSRVAHLIQGDELCAESGSGENPPPVNSPADLIYTIFTSGSTGRPKGAGVYHRGFNNLLNWFVREFGITGQDRSLLVSSFSFDLTQKNFYATIGEGGAIILLPPGPYDPEAVTGRIASNRVTLLNCTPSAAYPLLELDGGSRLERLSSLRCLFLGGEPISTRRLKPWTDSQYFHAEIVNTYGPTECSDICAFHRLGTEDMAGAHPVPLGRPIYNTTLAVMDDRAVPCPVGTTGELWIAGDGVGVGYITDPALTHERFIENPSPEVLPGHIVYRSGDLVRWRADGSLEFAGRSDHQVKIRGFRVELGEIENALEQSPLIKQAAVIARKASDDAAVSLAAYVVAQDSGVIPAESLRSFLRNRLPDHMVPGDFIQLDQLPLSPNGKVDRRSLTELEILPVHVAGPERADEMEEKIASVWRAVLRTDAIRFDKNFFDLGGDSLQVIEVHLRLKALLPGDRLSVTALFQYPTIDSLCEFLRAPEAIKAPGSAVEERARRQKAAFARKPMASSVAGGGHGPEKKV